MVLSQDRIPRRLSVVENSGPQKWLNLVLDLNGILVVTGPASAAIRGSSKESLCNWMDFSSTMPALIGPKAVYFRPGVREFLVDITKFLNSVVIWSSMKKSTVEAIATCLFVGLPSPELVLGQESCDKIETSRNIFLMDKFNAQKEMFLKTLSNSLFKRRHGSVVFNLDNTLLIDDSPEKSVCNYTGNAIFLSPWRREVWNDNFLIRDLLSWLRRLHSECPRGQLRDYVDSNRIGIPPLAPSSPLMNYIRNGMTLSTKNVGVIYEVPTLSKSVFR